MKKGQVYLLATIIIGFLIFTIITPSNFIHKKITDDDFEELSANYQIESSKILNQLLNREDLSKPLVESMFLNFTVSFTSYSKTKNPNFGIVYAFPYRDWVFLGNYADVNVTFNSTNPPAQSTLKGCFQKVSTSITIYGIDIITPDITTSLYDECMAIENYPLDSQINLTIENIVYPFQLHGNRSDIIIISREEDGEDIKVFIDG